MRHVRTADHRVAAPRGRRRSCRRGRLPAALLHRLPEQLRPRSRGSTKPAGLHAAGFFTPLAQLVDHAEDVGRHNAVDKVIGRMLMRDALPLSQHLLCVSGRTSFEIVQKAVIAGIPLVAAVSAPSSLAIDLAQRVRRHAGRVRPRRQLQHLLTPRPHHMISFSKVSKQYGRQILFVDASFQLNPGEKVGLVGPNGSGQDDAVPDDRRRGDAGRRRRIGAEAA